jgi:hypothetical protein
MEITIGRTVLYTLCEQDAEQINRRRTTGQSIADRIKRCSSSAITPSEGAVWIGLNGGWPIGAQAHIGNTVSAGYVFPMTVVRVWDKASGCINGQVLLDGNDTYWATSRHEGTEPGTWAWPEQV